MNSSSNNQPLKEINKPSGSYHHGNLKSSLVEACLDMLKNTPFEALSLRKLASKVGVAPTAVYNHFANKEELLVAVKIRCLWHFADYLEARSAKSEIPKQWLINLGKAYFNYALNYREYFNCIFRQELVPDEYVTQELIDSGMRAESELRSAVSALLKKYDIPLTQYNEGLGAFACWAIAHGVTSLAAQRVNNAAILSGRWPPEFMLHNEDSVNTAFDAMTEILVAGLLQTAKRN